jgi:hypothetical protein
MRGEHDRPTMAEAVKAEGVKTEAVKTMAQPHEQEVGT